MYGIRILGVGFALALLATACGESSSDTFQPVADTATTIAAAASDSERPCDGGAFPDDEEFRQMLCDLQWAQVDLLSAEGEFDTSWGGRISAAILLQRDDRATAMAELEAVLAEITSG